MRRIENDAWVRGLSRKNKIAWIRGAWDSEGSVSVNNSDDRFLNVNFAVKDKEFARLFRDMLREAAGIKSTMSFVGVQWKVSICNTADTLKFYEIVQPTIQRKRAKFEGAIRARKDNPPRGRGWRKC
jgi:hypothetical protein